VHGNDYFEWKEDLQEASGAVNLAGRSCMALRSGHCLFSLLLYYSHPRIRYLPFEQSKERSRSLIVTALHSEESRPCPLLGSTISVGQSLGVHAASPKALAFHHLLLAIRICGLHAYQHAMFRDVFQFLNLLCSRSVWISCRRPRAVSGSAMPYVE
jgi:hypothetical protein